ncbi:substrate-binding domain-containing protein [Maridesulfovibrio sp.]|uniref:substrate-binding domain-containing protein n=1 Tax=Maridesulfovibrio sp. TaxID=2795000 RepID=UPI0039F02CF2
MLFHSQMRRFIYFTIFISLFSTLLASNPANAAGADSHKNISIAVIPERGDLDFWDLLKKGVSKAATDDGKIKIFWIEPAGYGSFKEQRNKLEWCLNNNIDAVVISPVHGLRLKKALQKVVRKGIPVIQMVSKSPISKSGYVHSDNFNGGTLAADFLQGELNGSGSVILGLFTQGNSPVNSRVEGFKKRLKMIGSKIKIANSIYVGKSLKEGASKTRIAMYGNDTPSSKTGIKAVIGFNESSSEILLHTLSQMNKLDGIKFVAFNPDPQMIKGIKSGKIAAAIAQDPYEIGRLAVTQAVMAARGHKIPSNTKTNVYLITKDNLDNPKIQEILGLKKRTL